MKKELITIELLCDCGAKCGELTLPADHPKAHAPLAEHGIEKVECDACRDKRLYERQKA